MEKYTKVEKAILTEEQAKWFEKNKDVNFKYFVDEVEHFCQVIYFNEIGLISENDNRRNNLKIFKQLIQAYFAGYVVYTDDLEERFYIKFNFNEPRSYLVVDKKNNEIELGTREQTIYRQTQFTQSEIDKLKQDYRVKNLDLNVFKVKVPKEEMFIC